MIKLVIDVQQVGGFFPGIPVSPTNKTDHEDITSILLKVALNTKPKPVLCIVMYRYYNDNISYPAFFY
jgi:hypothetical protein